MKTLWRNRLARLTLESIGCTLVLHALFTAATGFVNGGFFLGIPRSLQSFPQTIAVVFVFVVIPLYRWGGRSLLFSALPLFFWKIAYAFATDPVFYAPGSINRAIYIGEFWPLWFEGPVTAVVIWLLFEWIERNDVGNASQGLQDRRLKSTRSRGFSLVEILVVMVIIGVLSALIFAVIGRAKDMGLRTVDISNMRQIYTAITLYEDAHDEIAPPTLLDLYPSWVSAKEIFHAPTDPVRSPNPMLGGYAAKLFYDSDRRSPFRISYGYLKVYPPFDQNLYKWREKRDDSQVGMLACPWHGDSQQSHYRKGAFDDFGPPMDGPILRINMDGSFFLLPSNRDKLAVGSVRDLFYNR